MLLYAHRDRGTEQVTSTVLGDLRKNVAVIGGSVSYNLGNMSTPAFQRVLTFSEKIVALINGRNPRDRPGLMIENLVGNMWRNPESGHPGHAGPAQIVKSPFGYSGELVEPSFSSAKLSEGLGSQNGEDERASRGHVPHHSH